MSTKSEPRFRIGRIVLRAAASGTAALIASAVVLTRPFSRAVWKEAPPSPASIYRNEGRQRGGTPALPLVSPFHLHTDPMAGLLLVNFERDPDRIYVGLEPQAFDDEVHGRGLLVIGWRVDGQVDVFHDPELRLDPRTYGIAGKGLHAMEERSFAGSRFELGDSGAQVDLRFRDLEDREIRIFIRETDTRPRRPFSFLAPMGSAASDPPALPLVFVHDFYFVRRAGTEIRIEIDSRKHRGDPIPLVLDGTRVHFLRYSADPFIVTWNPAAHGSFDVLTPVAEDPVGILPAEARGVRYELVANGGFREIRSMSRREGGHEVVVQFTPAFPHLLALADGVEVAGAFRIFTRPDAGTVTGRWRVTRLDRRLDLEVMPEGGWAPGEVPRMARLLFRAVSIFRTWPSTYLWRGTMQLAPPGHEAEGPRSFQAKWERIE
jgi:hypothetical protein